MKNVMKCNEKKKKFKKWSKMNNRKTEVFVKMDNKCEAESTCKRKR